MLFKVTYFYLLKNKFLSCVILTQEVKMELNAISFKVYYLVQSFQHKGDFIGNFISYHNYFEVFYLKQTTC